MAVVVYRFPMDGNARETRRARPEILAPAGDPLALRAAIASGAGAVYLGMARFNARGRAERFRGLTLSSCIEAAHRRGVRVYVTLNTLLHDDELGPALELAHEAQEAGADAAIVQDLGFADLLRRQLPALSLHGSTQMTIHGPEQAALAVERLGLRRVILARECSLEEVARIAERIRPLGAEAEVFVHGALCFAYSGQCLMSNFAGRRSANRGICAQNCRFDFTAARAPRAPAASGPAETGGPAGGSFLPLPVFDPRSATQLLSMKDLAAFESVAALAEAGVGSFKIEGRLKGPGYVAEVVRLYRSALDAWEEGKPFAAEEAARAAGRVYSRGFTNGYLSGRVDPAMRGDKRRLEGEPDATVLSANRKTGLLVLEPRSGHAIRAGQGYRYTHDRYRGGFRVIGVERASPGGDSAGGSAVQARVRFGSEATGRRYRRGATGRRRPPPPLPEGLALYLNDDPELEKRIQGLLQGVEIESESPAVGLRLQVRGRAGERLSVRAEAGAGRSVEAQSDEPLQPARARPLDLDLLSEHLGRLGGTGYLLEAIDCSSLEPGGFLGFPALHALRRELVRKLDLALRADRSKPRARIGLELPGEEPRRRETRLSVIAGSPEALQAALRAGAARVVVEDPLLESGGDGETARERLWAPVLHSIAEPWFRLPPIEHRDGADRRLIERLRARFPGVGVLCGHLGQVAAARLAGVPFAADLYLNGYNHRTAALVEELGARWVTLSLEVEAEEAARVARRARGKAGIEVVVGGAVFSMLTRQGYGLEPGRRLLSVSEHGHGYRFEASPAGTTTLYEARELVGPEALPILAGQVDWVRLDLAHQEGAAVEEIAGGYRSALERLSRTEGGPAGAKEEVRRAGELHRRHAGHGSFTGHLFRGSRRQDREEPE
jgi:putative protease